MTLKVRAYKNLHKDCWSVLNCRTNRLILHAISLKLEDCEFVVRPAGRIRVRKEKRKNVHAFAVGKLYGWGNEYIKANKGFKRIRYNPYLNETFVYAANGRPIKRAGAAVLNNDGLWIGESF